MLKKYTDTSEAMNSTTDVIQEGLLKMSKINRYIETYLEDAGVNQLDGEIENEMRYNLIESIMLEFKISRRVAVQLVDNNLRDLDLVVF